MLNDLLSCVRYEGSSKHKLNPHLFGLHPFNGERGDETLCDRDASFIPSKMASVLPMLLRGIQAGLIGDVQRQGVPTILWAVSDDGWIFEARITNSGMSEYHGYPLMATEAIALLVFERFENWANGQGNPTHRAAASACRERYGIT